MGEHTEQEQAKNSMGTGDVIRIMLYGCWIAILLCAVLLLWNRINAGRRVTELTVEAGNALPVMAEVFGNPGAELMEDAPDMTAVGDYELRVSVGGRRKLLKLSVVDTTPPVIMGAEDLTIYVGESVAYRKNVTVTDNAGDENVTLSVDTRQVNTGKVGDYSVTYVAEDKAGNTSKVNVTLHVKVYNATEIKLYEQVDRVLSQIVRPEMDRIETLRAVYEYVHNHIAYTPDSDKSDWIGEAYRAMFVTGQGDCFSYFSAAKAFLTRLDIPFYEVRRTPGLTTDTHYWMLVNVNEEGEPAWYHYDTTRLRTTYTQSGCLITDKQAAAYNKIRPYFYAYSREGLPEVATAIITVTPELEAYYD